MTINEIIPSQVSKKIDTLLLNDENSEGTLLLLLTWQRNLQVTANDAGKEGMQDCQLHNARITSEGTELQTCREQVSFI